MTAKVSKSTKGEEKQYKIKKTKRILKKNKRKAEKSLKCKELKAIKILKTKELKAIERQSSKRKVNTKELKKKMHPSLIHIEAAKKDRKRVTQREKELVLDLFGDDADFTDSEKTTIAPVLSKKKKRLLNQKKKKLKELKEKKKRVKKLMKNEQRLKKSTENEKTLKKSTKNDSNIPEDPYDIHQMKDLKKKKKPAWVDEDDMNIRVKDVVANMTKFRGQRGIREDSVKKYQMELKEKFDQFIGSTPDWAELKENSKEDSDNDEMVRSTGNYLSGESSFNLPKMSLEYKQMNDLNSSHTEGAFIQAIAFNPQLQVGLVAGSLKNLGAATLFQVDGKTNHRIHSVRFPSYPITCARFMQDGKRFVVGSDMYNYFFVYDMETSKETKIYVSKKFEKHVKENLYVSPDGELLIYLSGMGKMFVYDSATLSLIDTMEAPHNITSATFKADGSRMYTHGLTGEVCVWDLHARECVHKFYDEGCIAGRGIAMSPNNQYLACGSRSGIVNVYDTAELATSTPMPVKVLSNLTTSVNALTFNASSEILAMASNQLPNALKLVHFPSMTVFENFPRQGSIMPRCGVLQFSPQSGYLAVGNYSGAAPLYRLKHFSSY